MQYVVIGLLIAVVFSVKGGTLPLRFWKTTATLLAVLGFGGSLLAFLGWLSTSVPRENELISTPGTIAHVRTATRYSDDLVFLFEGSSTKYKYVDWYPHFERVRDELVIGQSLTVFTLPGGTEIWRVQSGNRDIVPFQDLVSARSENSRIALAVAIVLPIATAIGLLDLYRSVRRRRPTAPSSSPSA